tara:strand:- start:7 stop:153 length:147 start_codon:yes stop_codon:yes gene_type:complete
MTTYTSKNALRCKLPIRLKAIEAIYSLIWKKEKKDRQNLFIQKRQKIV